MRILSGLKDKSRKKVVAMQRNARVGHPDLEQEKRLGSDPQTPGQYWARQIVHTRASKLEGKDMCRRNRQSSLVGWCWPCQR